MARSEILRSLGVLDLMPDAMLVADVNGRILRVNAQAEQLFGYPHGALVGRPVEALLPERFGATHPQHRVDFAVEPHARPMGSRLTLAGRRRDGGEFPVEVSLSPLPVGEEVLVLASVRDSSERVQLERERAAETERARALLQLVLDQLPGGAYLVRGPDARLVLANRAAEAVWGATWEVGQPMAAFLRETGVRYEAENGRELAPDDLVTVQVVRGGAAVSQRREVVRRPDGSRLAVLLSAVAMPGDLLPVERVRPRRRLATAEREPAALVLLQDISVLQAAEHLKDEFVSVAAHELRTPLAAIQGFASMLRVQTALGRGPALVDWQQEAIAEIEEASARLNGLVTDLLDATRIQAGRLELHLVPLDLLALLRRSLMQLQVTTTRHMLTLDAPPDPVLLAGEGPRLEQVVGNLVGNAIKYSPDGGPITVTVRADPAAARVEVRIRDAGIGIPADQQAKLFQRFARASNVHEHAIAGTGLGLYVCRELVERHGGQIWFESAEGSGTTFFLTLPLLPLSPRAADPDASGGRTRTPEASVAARSYTPTGRSPDAADDGGPTNARRHSARR